MDGPRNDGGARALTRLPSQWRGKPRFRGLARALAMVAQEVDAGLYTLWTGRQLATAAGDMLDVYGGLVGEERLGRVDATYRVAIQARQAINRGSGTAPELLRLLRLLAPQPLQLVLTEFSPPGVVLTVSNGALAHPEAVHAALNSARPAGVGLRLHYQDGPDAERFVTEGGVGLGFGGDAADYVSSREDVQPWGYLPGLTDDEADPNQPTPAAAPKLTLTGARIPADFGSFEAYVLDTGGPLRFTWVEGNGYGNTTGQVMYPDGPGTETPVVLLNEYPVAGPEEVGFAITWGEGEPYSNEESWLFEDHRPNPTDVFGVSTPPVLAAVGPLAFTGQAMVEVVRGAPGYTFRYTLGSQPARTVDMARGTAVPLLLADGVTPSGLAVTWPNVTTHYPEAKWAWWAAAADATVGGRFTYVLGG